MSLLSHVSLTCGFSTSIVPRRPATAKRPRQRRRRATRESRRVTQSGRPPQGCSPRVNPTAEARGHVAVVRQLQTVGSKATRLEGDELTLAQSRYTGYFASATPT